METEDRRHGKRYKQVFRENMSQKDEPIIRTVKKHNDTRQEWTKITFKPDYPRCVSRLVLHRSPFTTSSAAPTLCNHRGEIAL